VFALYLKTKNFHWHMTSTLRDYHLLLDEHGTASMTDPIAERFEDWRTDDQSIGLHLPLQRVLDNDADMSIKDMIAELAEDNKMLARVCARRTTWCDEHRDVATASLIEV